MPVVAAVTYVLRSCREPICAAIMPPRVCVCSGFTDFSVNAASWFGDVAVGGFYFPPYMHSCGCYNGCIYLLMMKEDREWAETHEMVQEETVVESETRIVECERLALVWGSGDNNLSDAHIFKVGTYPRPPTLSKYVGSCNVRHGGVTFNLFIETV
jgi:hypothetical protein